MTVSSELWQANQDLAQECLKHPFVQGIANGTLEQKKFAYYVGQDAFFLEAFARAYSIVAAKSPDGETFRIFHNLAAGVLEELHLHEDFAATWKVDLRAVQAQPATRRYTDFLLATAWSSDVGSTTVAMLPCMRLYTFLGQQLASSRVPSHEYSNWIYTYSAPEFEQLAQQLETLTERFTSPTPQVHFLYRYAMLCERDFFEAAWMVE